MCNCALPNVLIYKNLIEAASTVKHLEMVSKSKSRRSFFN